MVNKEKWIWRGIVIFSFILAVVLILAFPYKIHSPDSWAYYYAIDNFSHGRLVISDELHLQQVLETKQQQGVHSQYVQLSDGSWALEKAPGYVFFVVPFKWLGIPKAANVLLALGVTIVTYLLLRRMLNERAACIGSVLMLLTPVSLIMLQRSYMATFAACAFLAIGGGLYLYSAFQEKEKLNLPLLFLAGLFLSWAVVVRYTNLPVAVIFGLHFVVTRLLAFRRGHRRRAIIEAIPFTLGIAISATVLLIYNAQVFGSPFDYGYNYTTYPIAFGLGYIWGNLTSTPKALLVGFPLLVVAIPGLLYISWEKISTLFGSSRAESSGERATPWPELHWSVFLVLVGWFLSIYVYYFLYEWTSVTTTWGIHYMTIDRFYLPALFPLVVISSLLLARLPLKLIITVLAVCLLIALLLLPEAVYNWQW